MLRAGFKTPKRMYKSIHKKHSKNDNLNRRDKNN